MTDFFLDVEKEAAEYNNMLLERWHVALERSSNTLGKDKVLAEQLGTPEAFLQYLEAQQQSSNSQWLAKARTQIIPYIKAIRSFSILFLALLAAPPTSVGFTVVWGVFFLSIQVCLQTEERCQNMLDIHRIIRQTLMKINRLSAHLRSGLEQDEDFKEALVEIYVVLVKFWVEAIKHIRNTRMTKDPKEPWKTIKSNLSRTIAEVEERYRFMKEVADDHAMHEPDSATSLPMRPGAATQSTEQRKRPVFVLNIPENAQFQGRTDLIERIHAHLNPSSQSARLRCFTIHGLGGVGKTQTAAAYAYRYGSRQNHESVYDAVLWINSENDESLRSSFADVAFALKLDGVTGTTGPDRIRREVQNWLSDTGGLYPDNLNGIEGSFATRTDLKWLLIFDNVDCWDTITGCWPPGTANGSIIITSRDWSLSNQPANAGEELTKLDPSDSRALFEKLLNSYDQDDSDSATAFGQILVYMDGLPLAIHQVASIINAYGFSLPEFVTTYKDNRSQMHQDRGASSYAFYKDTLHTVWKFPTGETETRDMQLRHLLGVLSLLAPDSISQGLLQQPIPIHGELQSPRRIYGEEILLRSLLMKLRSTAMIRKSGETTSMHRLTQAAFLDFVDASHKNEVFATASTLVFQAFPKQHRGDPLLSQWKSCSEIAPHVRSLVDHWQELHKQGCTIETPVNFIQLLCNAAWYLREINDYEASLLFINVGIKAAKPIAISTPTWELLVAHLHNTRGVVLWNQYDYTQSREALEKALELRTEHMQKDNIELIGTKANLASLVAAEGRYEEAQGLYREAEKDHNNSTENAASKRLASCRYAATQGRLHTELKKFNEAEEELQRSLKILNSGEDNALYRRAIEYCFGNLRLAESRLNEAQDHYQSCLDDYPKTVTDKDQIRSCGCYYKLGHIALMEHEGSKAAGYLQKALEVASQVGSMGWQGRIATLQAALLQEHPKLVTSQGDSPEQLQRRADALRAALSSLSAEEEGLGKEFHIYTPWQTR